jgi:biotin-dependent carboxylase-like uncharacterized protein
MIEVLASGPLSTVQDGGRGGFAAQGVPRAGAFDRGALLLANRLVGNPPEAAGIEITLGGLGLRLHAAATLALTGAPCPGIDWGTPTSLPAGSIVRLDTPPTGLRSVLAVRGGIAVPAVLGSRSTDTLSGLGPAPLRPGDLLPVGPQPQDLPSADSAPVPAPRPRVRIIPGPREDWFEPGALRTLTSARWQVAADSDRIGVRLEGPELTRTRTGELPSEPTLPGAIQVPHGGRPILLGPDAPVTGGYPVIAVVVAADLDIVAQLRPGAGVRFVERRAP